MSARVTQRRDTPPVTVVTRIGRKRCSDTAPGASIPIGFRDSELPRFSPSTKTALVSTSGRVLTDAVGTCSDGGSLRGRAKLKGTAPIEVQADGHKVAPGANIQLALREYHTRTVTPPMPFVKGERLAADIDQANLTPAR